MGGGGRHTSVCKAVAATVVLVKDGGRAQLLLQVVLVLDGLDLERVEGRLGVRKVLAVTRIEERVLADVVFVGLLAAAFDAVAVEFDLQSVDNGGRRGSQGQGEDGGEVQHLDGER